MTQSSLWQTNLQNNNFAEMCNALYERELRGLAHAEISSIQGVQGRLKSLPHYINKSANLMAQLNEQGHTPLTLDVQNATWSTQQARQLPLVGEEDSAIFSWYLDLLAQPNISLLGLVVPVLVIDHIVLDCIDRIDVDNKRLRTNVFGWFSLIPVREKTNKKVDNRRLLKPNKKVMLAACAGHRWQTSTCKNKLRPIIPSLRELLLSCAINWQNFKQPLTL
ncbi:MAG: hypothetical protein JKY81_00370 [Colwellia sp.]|nr:hypothetical protein [Colwellia sp.]